MGLFRRRKEPTSTEKLLEQFEAATRELIHLGVLKGSVIYPLAALQDAAIAHKAKVKQEARDARIRELARDEAIKLIMEHLSKKGAK